MPTDEKSNNQEEKTEATVEDTGTGSEPKAASLIDGAHSAAERLEAANKKTEELVSKQEELYAKQRLAGRAEAGTEEKKKEMTAIDYAKSISEGVIPE